MLQKIRHATIVAALVTTQVVCATRPAQGGRFFDWLFGPPSVPAPPVVSYYPPVPAYPLATQAMPAPGTAYTANYAQVGYPTAMPTTSYYSPSAASLPGTSSCSSCQGTTMTSYLPAQACPAPTTLAYPTQTAPRSLLGSCGLGSHSATVTAARPTYYRTSWQRVPVTSYRPVTTSDPVTGCPVTVMRPCTTYAWQPERQRCGFFGRLFGLCDPAPTAYVCCPDPCTTQYVADPGCCGTPVPSAMPGTAPVAPEPYYPTPAIPPAASGVMPPSSPTLVPGSGGTPADFPPSLAPGESQGMGMSQPNRSGYPGPQTPRGAADSNQGSEAGLGNGGARINAPQNAAPAADAAPSATLKRMIPLPIAEEPDNAVNIQPIPGPEARPAPPQETPNAPQLLDPQDRVAAVRAKQAWTYTAIAWPKTERDSSPGRTAPPAPREQPRQLDDSGWYSIAR